VRSLFIVLVVLGAGCVADSTEPAPPPPDKAMPVVEVSLMDQQDGNDIDVCALAALLPADDICSLACDPSAMVDRLISDGNDRGTCYQLYCALPEEQHVLVGVCLPP
jgi:hypothetical protein